jgi:uncharacterized protein DUF2637
VVVADEHADRVTRGPPGLAVVDVAVVVSYENTDDLARNHGESGWGRLIPLTVDGPIYASSMVMLDSARQGGRVPGMARWLFGWALSRRGPRRLSTALVALIRPLLDHPANGSEIPAFWWPRGSQIVAFLG